MSNDPENNKLRKPPQRSATEKPFAHPEKAVAGGPHFPVVAIGASAGGLNAYERFFTAMPADSGMAFVLIQHLEPTHETSLPALLARHTTMPVIQAARNMPLERNCVYVIPPNRYLTLGGGAFHLETPAAEERIHLPIDHFFRSLAEQCQECAIAIVLSGTGTDGTGGLLPVKDNGGLAMAQTPDSADHDGMPGSAVSTGVLDHVLDIEDMPEVLLGHVRHPRLKDARGAHALGDDLSEHLQPILALLKARASYDFRAYKPGTLIRRLSRRMNLNHIAEAGPYLELLRDSPDELRKLGEDLLIGVTRFFRDPEAFGMLGDQVIAKLVHDKAEHADLRVWVAGCATGEEAYSLAIVIREALEAQDKQLNLRIFATDIDTRALATARAGVYPENIAADVSFARLECFFTRHDQRYRIDQSIRACVTFAPQNLVSDAPFSKLDLISCRNLLIYLEADIQKKLLSLFHFALNDGGYLFLGHSETIGALEDFFDPLSRRWRLFRRTGPSRHLEAGFPVLARDGERDAGNGAASRLSAGRTAGLGELARDRLLDRYAPATVLVSQKYRVLYVHGETDAYLGVPRGEPNYDLMALLRPGLASRTRAAVHQALSEGGRATVGGATIDRDGVSHAVAITAEPVASPEYADKLVLVSFEDTPDAPARGAEDAAGDAGDPASVQLERELQATRNDLQGTIEDLQTFNEEWQAANEELETSKEELQALNEELKTANTELQTNVEELELTSNDLNNLLVSTDIATLFLDRAFCVRRFTPAVKTLFRLIASDIGRPIADVTHSLIGDDTLLADAEAVLAGLVPIQTEVRSEAGRWYIRRVLPYRSHDDHIQGVVVTFVDISECREAELEAQERKAYAENIIDTVHEGLLVLDAQMHVVSANPAFYRMFEAKPEDTQGRLIYDLGDHQWNIPALHELLEDILPDNSSFENFEVEHEFPLIGPKCMLLNARRLQQPDGRDELILLAISDITEAQELIRQVTYYATHDSLTDLENRRQFEQRLERVLTTSREQDTENVLCYLDLDQFKIINDTCGHLAGDELLRQIGAVFHKHVRARDTVARLGGDEFAVLMEHCNRAQGERVAEAFIGAVRDFRFVWDGQVFSIGVSLGLVVITPEFLSVRHVLEAADAACYAAKREGRNRVHSHYPGNDDLARRHGGTQWVTLLSDALANDALTLHFQPIVGLRPSDGEARNYELLVRAHDEHGRLTPAAVFFPTAERYELASRLDRWVINAAFDWFQAHPAAVENLGFCCINLSGQTLGDEACLKLVKARLKEKALPAGKLCFEITETAAISNLTTAVRFIEALKVLGCRFALDDFGSGFSSFGYLKTLPVDFLKIDGLFMKHIEDDSVDLAMVKSINEVGHLLGKQTIAECVESEAAVEKLRGLGVDYVQGHALAYPQAMDELLNE